MMQANRSQEPVLLDTDVFSWLIWQQKSHATNYKRFAPLVNGRPWFLSFATVGELISGSINPKAPFGPKRILALRQHIQGCTTLIVTDDVINIWGELHAKFRGQIDTNDMWIAACALAQHPTLPIATNNLKHFKPMSETFGISLVHPSLS